MPLDFRLSPVSEQTASTGILSTVESEAIGNAGNIEIQANSLTLTNGAEVQSITRGAGRAGDIQVNVSEQITASGTAPLILGRSSQILGGFSSGLIAATEAGATDQGGNISVTTDTLHITDGAVLNARTRSNSPGGAIAVTANTLELTRGRQILTSSFGTGNAGYINLNVADNITLSGYDPTYEARLQQFGASVVDNVSAASGLFANTTLDSSGTGGNIQVQAGTLLLDNQARISTETASNQGGNITLELQDLLLLRDGSTISATAGTAQAGGDGGNITIKSPLIVAVPEENSDITANAFSGRGGSIDITAQGIFGIESRPRLTPLSDITASSELGIEGEVEITTPDVDPSQGLTELPAEVVDASEQIDQTCATDSIEKTGVFVVTGRGGLPPNPAEILNPELVLTRLATLADEEATDRERMVAHPRVSTAQPAATASSAIVEAQGWVIRPDGKAMLVAEPPTVAPPRMITPTPCNRS